MKQVLENWRMYLKENIDLDIKAIDVLLENSPIGQWNVLSQAPNNTVYELRIGEQNYDVVFKKKTSNSPIDISFNVSSKRDDPSSQFKMSGRQEVFLILNSIVGIMKEFIKENPNEKVFAFTGAEDTLGSGASSQTKRTRVFTKFVERIIRADSELKNQIADISDAAWAGSPNMVLVKLNGWNKQ